MTKPRTIILTPPGHKDCKVSPGPLTYDEIVFLGGENNPLFRPCGFGKIYDENKLKCQYFAECMGEAPAWEGWAAHIWTENEENEHRIPLKLVRVVNKNHWEYDYIDKIDGECTMVLEPPADIQRRALAWLLRAGCAKEVVS